MATRTPLTLDDCSGEETGLSSFFIDWISRMATGTTAGTALEPKIFLRNASTAAVAVSPGVSWHNDGASGSSPLPRITLLPGQIKVMRLADIQKTGQIPADATWATVTLGFTGRSADIVAVAMSYDKTSRYGLQTPFSEGISGLMKGGMWHVDDTHNTLITVGNGGDEPTRRQVTLFYNGGQSKYRVEKLLPPGQQTWLNLGEVLRNQVPDSDGETIPSDVMFGSYELRDLDHPVLGLLYEGKLVVDKTYGHASYGCVHCCGYSKSQVSPTPFSGPPGMDNPDTYQAYSVCNAHWDDFDFATNWQSSTPSVATLPTYMLHTVAPGTATGSAKNTLAYQQFVGAPCPNEPMQGSQPVTVAPTVTISGSGYLALLKSGSTGGGNTTTFTATGNPPGGSYSWTAVGGEGNITVSNATSQTVTVQSVAVGTYTVQVKYTVNNQPATATAVGKVQQPGSLGVVSNDTQALACTNLPGSYTTEERLIQYQVLDTSSPPVAVLALNMRASEALAYNSNGCDTPPLNPTTNAVTGTNGYFPAPDMLALCSVNCLPANNSGIPTSTCTNSIAQTWTVNGYAVKSDTVAFTCIGPPTGAP